MNKIAIALLVLAPALGCAPSTQSPTGTTGDPTTPTAPACDGSTDPTCMSKTDSPSSACGAQTFPISSTKVSPNIFFVVDASGSMAADDNGDEDPTKWNGLQTALDNVLMSHTGQAQWGLAIFPSSQGNGCQAGQVNVPIAAGDEAAITSQINAITADDVYNFGGGTPTAATMQMVSTVAALKDTTRPNYVVLMTDGQPNCEAPHLDNDAPPTQTVAALTALASASPSVKTFVIGFGDVNESSPNTLNAFATAGGTARAGSVQYYQASNATDLEHAFDTIVTGVASCDYKLAMPPTDPTLVAPAFDNTPVPQNTTNGFSYDSTTQTVTFHGTSCTQLQSGTVHNVEFEYGCPPTTVQ